PRSGPPPGRSRPCGHRGGIAVWMGAVRRMGGRDYRREPVRGIGARARGHARIRIHPRARRGDREARAGERTESAMKEMTVRNPLQALRKAGQSIWLDYISRNLLQS